MSIRGVDEIDDLVPVRVVLASVFDKSGLDELIPGMLEHCPGMNIISTGGTYKKLRGIIGDDSGQVLTSIDEFTGAPETEGGLVKTLSREKSLALLTETHCESHQRDLRDAQVAPIDVVLCNLYPFAEVVADPDVTPETARGNIDIGGPCMLREAAKNFLRCVVMTNSGRYPGLLKELEMNNGATSLKFRYNEMREVFNTVAVYDRRIADYFSKHTADEAIACYKTVHERGK